MPAAFAAAVFPSMSAPCSVARRRLMIDAEPIFLISWIALGEMAPAPAPVVLTLGKFRMPGPSCLTTCALAAVPMTDPTKVSSASRGAVRCMLHLLRRAAYHSCDRAPRCLTTHSLPKPHQLFETRKGAR